MKYTEWLTPEKIRLLKEWRGEGISTPELARRMGVNQNMLYQWKKRSPEFAEAIQAGCPKAAKWRTPEGLSRLKELKAAGLSDPEIAEEIGVGRHTVAHWKRRYPAIAEALQPPPAQVERWLTPERLRMVKSWKDEGISNVELAARMGIGKTTLGCWMQAHPELAAAIQRIPPKYEKWLTPEGLARVKGWTEAGMGETEIAETIGIGMTTMCRWKNIYPEFADALAPERQQDDYIMENALFQSALNHEETEYTETTDPNGGVSTVETTRHVPGKTSAQILWLHNRKRDTWGFGLQNRQNENQYKEGG